MLDKSQLKNWSKCHALYSTSWNLYKIPCVTSKIHVLCTKASNVLLTYGNDLKLPMFNIVMLVRRHLLLGPFKFSAGESTLRDQTCLPGVLILDFWQAFIQSTNLKTKQHHNSLQWQHQNLLPPPPFQCTNFQSLCQAPTIQVSVKWPCNIKEGIGTKEKGAQVEPKNAWNPIGLGPTIWGLRLLTIQCDLHQVAKDFDCNLWRND